MLALLVMGSSGNERSSGVARQSGGASDGKRRRNRNETKHNWANGDSHDSALMRRPNQPGESELEKLEFVAGLLEIP